MGEPSGKLAGQKPELVLQILKEIFEKEGDGTPLHMKNHLAISFFKMIMNDDEVDDKMRNVARTYLQLYEFLSTFDE